MNGSPTPEPPHDNIPPKTPPPGLREGGAEKETAPEKSRDGLSRIRTFRADAERFVKEKGVTMTSLLAQQKKRVIQPPVPHPRRKKIFIFLIIFIFVAGAGVGVFFFYQNGGVAPVVRVEKPNSVYPLFDDRVITVKNSPAEFIPEWQNLLLRTIPEGQMLGVFVYNESRERYLSPGEWFDFLGISLPSSLRATIISPWTLGVLGTSQGGKPVFIIPVTSFEQAFAGMLAWEQDQPLVIRNLLGQSIPQRQFEQFQDMVIKNQDVRFLRNEQGQMILAYGFFNRRILIITTSLEAMEKIIERFLVTPPTL